MADRMLQMCDANGCCAAYFGRMPKLLGDIRLWVLLTALVRLIGITSPPLETAHSWRQAFTNMVARNMAEEGIDLLHPRTDLSGERPGVVASEFPGFNAAVALLYRSFGPAHWYGRLVALVASALGAWAFHALLRQRYGERVAFLAAFILLWSSWFVYGRKSMPDVFSVALVLIALWAVDRALRTSAWWFALAIPMAAIGGLCKIPAVVLLAPWALMGLEHGITRSWRALALTSLAMAIAPVAWWYFVWQPHLLAAYGNPLYFPYPLAEGLQQLWAHAGRAAERFRFSALMSHAAFLGACLGAWRALRNRDARTASVALGILLPFALIMAKAGDVFALHAYYIIPLVPLLALLAGLGLERLPRGMATAAVLALVVAEGAGMRWTDLTGGDERAYLLEAEGLADRFTGPQDLVATASGLDPRPMYYLHRSGWNLTPEKAQQRHTLDSLAALGLRAVFVERREADAAVPWPVLHEDADWRVHGAPLRMD